MVIGESLQLLEQKLDVLRIVEVEQQPVVADGQVDVPRHRPRAGSPGRERFRESGQRALPAGARLLDR